MSLPPVQYGPLHNPNYPQYLYNSRAHDLGKKNGAFDALRRGIEPRSGLALAFRLISRIGDLLTSRACYGTMTSGNHDH
jgi:hypothetical protein